MDKRLVLIVDDSKINRKLLCNILKENYRLIEADNGQIALNLLKEHSGEVSAILLDLTMPVLDGYEFLKIRSESSELSSIPVIVQTQKEGVEAEIKCLADGASDFLSKPYNPKLLLHRLATIIKLRENESFITLVQHDTLTGLYNTEGFYAKVKQVLSDYNSTEKQFYMLCIDLVQFKIVNELFGIEKGDEVLCFIADLLKEHLGSKALISRFSGDRFHALIDYDIKSIDLSNFFDKLNNAPVSSALNIQFGIYKIEDKLSDVRFMCDSSKLALSNVKGKYGETFSYYDQSMYDQILEERKIEAVMEKALEERQFVVYFQPKCEIVTGRVIGAEALVRWNNPDEGFMSPGLFIPLFEKNGFITKLDKFVWEEACRYNKLWLDKGLPIVPISVNVSRNDIFSEDLVSYFPQLVKKYNLPPSMLHLEITETAYTQNQDRLISMVKLLSDKGFYIEMDDFGSGYSSLNMLSELPVDMLKLDMLFLKNRSKKTNRRSIISLVMGIAKELNLDVIAEGVEREEDVDYLKSIGCLFAQGYFYSKPMPADDFFDLIIEEGSEIKRNVKHISFSPTRNSLRVGSYLSCKLGNEILINVTKNKARELTSTVQENELLVISFPVHSGRIPVLFSDYLKSQVKLNNSKVVIVTTYGNRAFEDALVEAEDIVKNLGGIVVGALAIVAQHSYTNKIGANRPNIEDFILIDNFASLVEERLLAGTVVSLPGNRPYRQINKSTKNVFMPVHNENECINCNNCHVVCPTGASALENPNLCIKCFACVTNCPVGTLVFENTEMDKTIDYLEENCTIPKKSEFF